MNPIKNKAYIVAVDMGYGHQRAVFPLMDDSATPSEWNIVDPMIISANNYPGIPNKFHAGIVTRKTQMDRGNPFVKRCQTLIYQMQGKMVVA